MPSGENSVTDLPPPHRAFLLAKRLHAAQLDQQGKPYLDHLDAVVENLHRRFPNAPDYAIEAAWLHDSMEDQGATEASLAREGISPEAIRLIQGLSRPEGVSYKDFIATIANSGDVWLIAVKLADNEHNRHPARRTPGSNIAEKRYIPAAAVLEAGLARALEQAALSGRDAFSAPPRPTKASIEAQLRARLALLEMKPCPACGAAVTEDCRRSREQPCGRLAQGRTRAAAVLPEIPPPRPGATLTEQTAMTHLGNVLQMLAELAPGDRSRAFDLALEFYNTECPDARVEPQPGYVSRLVMVGPPDWPLPPGHQG